MNEKNIVFITLVTSLQQQMILTFTCSYYLSPSTTALHKGSTATNIKHILKVLDSSQING